MKDTLHFEKAMEPAKTKQSSKKWFHREKEQGGMVFTHYREDFQPDYPAYMFLPVRERLLLDRAGFRFPDSRVANISQSGSTIHEAMLPCVTPGGKCLICDCWFCLVIFSNRLP